MQVFHRDLSRIVNNHEEISRHLSDAKQSFDFIMGNFDPPTRTAKILAEDFPKLIAELLILVTMDQNRKA